MVAHSGEMNKLPILYKGIARAKSDKDIEDGFLQEAINVRHKKGKLVPRGHATKIFNLPEDEFDQIWYHDQDNLANFIGYNQLSGELRLIDMSVGTSSLIDALNAGESIQVVFLKYYMIVVSDSDTKTYLWSNGAYVFVSVNELLKNSAYVEFKTEDRGSDDYSFKSEQGIGAESIKGNYFKLIDSISKEEGRLTGALAYRIALRMYDGSYVFHTLPEIISIDDSFDVIEYEADGGGQENDPRQIGFLARLFKAKFNPQLFAGFNADIYSDVCIFFSRNSDQYDWDTFTDEDLSYGEPDYSIYKLSELIQNQTDEWKQLPDSDAFYLVHEESIRNIQSKTEEYEVDIDTKDFYQDYATREVLTINNFTHHKIRGRVAYTYNDRLILAATTTKLGSYKTISTHGGSLIGTLIVSVLLKTSSGDSVVVYQLENQSYSVSPAGRYNFTFNYVIGYPDSRASEMKIYFKSDLPGSKQTLLSVLPFDSESVVSTIKLKKSKNFNYSYFMYDKHKTLEQGFETIVLFADDLYTTAEYVNLNQSGTIYDSNRVQISELKNPLYFPAQNSYQVGTGEVLAVATNSEPLSQGQFGQFPLIVFTSKGIWTLLQGSGEVLFASIQPLNGEVAIDKRQIISLTQGVTYSTEEGLFVISGRDVQEITQLLTGRINTDFQNNTHYQYFLDHISLVQLLSSLSTVDAKSYILGANVGFDKKNEELIISNSNYGYSYIFNFESDFWYKIDESFRLLINVYPKLYVVQENSANDGVYGLSDEHFNTDVQILLTTRPLKLNAGSTFKILQRIIQRCEIETTANTFAGFYIFGSNDFRKWQLLQGVDKKTGLVTDLFTTRSHTKCKYFIVVLAGQLKEDSSINELDIQYYLKLSNKLR